MSLCRGVREWYITLTFYAGDICPQGGCSDSQALFLPPSLPSSLLTQIHDEVHRRGVMVAGIAELLAEPGLCSRGLAEVHLIATRQHHNLLKQCPDGRPWLVDGADDHHASLAVLLEEAHHLRRGREGMVSPLGFTLVEQGK